MEIRDKNLLNWWKNCPFSNVSNVPRKILSIPASSTTCKRDFSIAGYVLEERRCNLSPEAMDTIFFLSILEKNKQVFLEEKNFFKKVRSNVTFALNDIYMLFFVTL